MKKKLSKGFVTLTLVAILSLSFNSAAPDQGSYIEKSPQNSSLSTDELNPCPWSLCWTWCSLSFMHFCELRCLDEHLICPQMIWPE
jgi:hypothetical protein